MLALLAYMIHTAKLSNVSYYDPSASVVATESVASSGVSALYLRPLVEAPNATILAGEDAAARVAADEAAEQFDNFRQAFEVGLYSITTIAIAFAVTLLVYATVQRRKFLTINEQRRKEDKARRESELARHFKEHEEQLKQAANAERPALLQVLANSHNDIIASLRSPASGGRHIVMRPPSPTQGEHFFGELGGARTLFAQILLLALLYCCSSCILILTSVFVNSTWLQDASKSEALNVTYFSVDVMCLFLVLLIFKKPVLRTIRWDATYKCAKQRAKTIERLKLNDAGMLEMSPTQGGGIGAFSLNPDSEDEDSSVQHPRFHYVVSPPSDPAKDEAKDVFSAQLASVSRSHQAAWGRSSDSRAEDSGLASPSHHAPGAEDETVGVNSVTRMPFVLQSAVASHRRLVDSPRNASSVSPGSPNDDDDGDNYGDSDFSDTEGGHSEETKSSRRSRSHAWHKHESFGENPNKEPSPMQHKRRSQFMPHAAHGATMHTSTAKAPSSRAKGAMQTRQFSMSVESFPPVAPADLDVLMDRAESSAAASGSGLASPRDPGMGETDEIVVGAVAVPGPGDEGYDVHRVLAEQALAKAGVDKTMKLKGPGLSSRAQVSMSCDETNDYQTEGEAAAVTSPRSVHFNDTAFWSQDASSEGVSAAASSSSAPNDSVALRVLDTPEATKRELAQHAIFVGDTPQAETRTLGGTVPGFFTPTDQARRLTGTKRPSLTRPSAASMRSPINSARSLGSLRSPVNSARTIAKSSTVIQPSSSRKRAVALPPRVLAAALSASAAAAVPSARLPADHPDNEPERVSVTRDAEDSSAGGQDGSAYGTSESEGGEDALVMAIGSARASRFARSPLSSRRAISTTRMGVTLGASGARSPKTLARSIALQRLHQRTDSQPGSADQSQPSKPGRAAPIAASQPSTPGRASPVAAPLASSSGSQRAFVHTQHHRRTPSATSAVIRAASAAAGGSGSDSARLPGEDFERNDSFDELLRQQKLLLERQRQQKQQQQGLSSQKPAGAGHSRSGSGVGAAAGRNVMASAGASGSASSSPSFGASASDAMARLQARTNLHH